MNHQDYLKAIKNLKKWDYAYFQTHQSLVSDEYYDQIYAQVIKYESDHPDQIVSDSPTQKVNDFVDQTKTKVYHLYPVLSLAKAHNESDVNKFLKQFPSNAKFIVQPKIDGATLVLRYDQNGQLEQILSRGDGQSGTNIIHLLTAIKGVMPTIDVTNLHFATPIKHYLIRGEVFIAKNDFEVLAAGGQHKNPRNLAAGSLNLKDVEIAKQRKLQFIAYDFKAIDQNRSVHHLANQYDVNQYLATNQMATISVAAINQDLINDHLTIINQFRHDYPYEIDGAVIKPFDLNYLEQLGLTNKYPKALLAYKYPAQRVLTTIRTLQIDVAKTGRLSYTVSVDPVNINGNLYHTVNLHNSDLIKKANWSIGDQVQLYLAGEIIPQFDQIVNKNPDPNAKLINYLWTNCAFCYQPIINDACLNENCSERQIKLLIDQAKALDLRGLGQAHIRKCYEARTITNLNDLMNLDALKLEPIATDDIASSKLINNILNNQKPLTLSQFLLALQVENVAAATIKKLVNDYPTLEQLLAASDQLLNAKQKWAQNMGKTLKTLDQNLIAAYKQKATNDYRNKNWNKSS